MLAAKVLRLLTNTLFGTGNLILFHPFKEALLKPLENCFIKQVQIHLKNGLVLSLRCQRMRSISRIPKIFRNGCWITISKCWGKLIWIFLLRAGMALLGETGMQSSQDTVRKVISIVRISICFCAGIQLEFTTDIGPRLHYFKHFVTKQFLVSLNCCLLFLCSIWFIA